MCPTKHRGKKCVLWIYGRANFFWTICESDGQDVPILEGDGTVSASYRRVHTVMGNSPDDLVYVEIFGKNTRQYEDFRRNSWHFAVKLGQSATRSRSVALHAFSSNRTTNVSDHPSLSPAHWSRVRSSPLVKNIAASTGGCFVAKKGRQCEIPLGWTDLAQDDPLTTLAAGKSWFRAADLLELAHPVKASADEENPIMEILVYSVCPSRFGFPSRPHSGASVPLTDIEACYCTSRRPA
jgi:hypothetical protein